VHGPHGIGPGAPDTGCFGYLRGMRFKPCFLPLAWALAMPAFAQTAPPVPVDAADCKAQEAVLERDMALARSRGQMLRRRELGDELSALQARCAAIVPPVPAQGRAARIEKLEQEIRTLRAELDRAEEQLRGLRSESP
jgi:Protein of unknown function (DUF1090)